MRGPFLRPYIREISKAKMRVPVIAEHGIDAFRELSTASFVDATRINPEMCWKRGLLIVESGDEVAKVFDFREGR